MPKIQATIVVEIGRDGLLPLYKAAGIVKELRNDEPWREDLGELEGYLAEALKHTRAERNRACDG